MIVAQGKGTNPYDCALVILKPTFANVPNQRTNQMSSSNINILVKMQPEVNNNFNKRLLFGRLESPKLFSNIPETCSSRLSSTNQSNLYQLGLWKQAQCFVLLIINLSLFVGGIQAKGLVGKLPGNPASCPEEPCNSDPKQVLHALKYGVLFFGLSLMSPVVFYFGNKLMKKIWHLCRRSPKVGSSPSKDKMKQSNGDYPAGVGKQLGKQTKRAFDPESGIISGHYHHQPANLVSVGSNYDSVKQNNGNSNGNSNRGSSNSTKSQQQIVSTIFELGRSIPAAAEQQHKQHRNGNYHFGEDYLSNNPEQQLQSGKRNPLSHSGSPGDHQTPSPELDDWLPSRRKSSNRQLYTPEQQQKQYPNGSDFDPKHRQSYSNGNSNNNTYGHRESVPSPRVASNSGNGSPLQPYERTADARRHRFSLLTDHGLGGEQQQRPRQRSPSGGSATSNNHTNHQHLQQTSSPREEMSSDRKQSLRNSRPGSGRRNQQRIHPAPDAGLAQQFLERDNFPSPDEELHSRQMQRPKPKQQQQLYFENNQLLADCKDTKTITTTSSTRAPKPGAANELQQTSSTKGRADYYGGAVYQQQERPELQLDPANNLSVPNNSTGAQHRHSIDGSILNNMVHNYIRPNVGQGQRPSDNSQQNNNIVTSNSANGNGDDEENNVMLLMDSGGGSRKQQQQQQQQQQHQLNRYVQMEPTTMASGGTNDCSNGKRRSTKKRQAQPDLHQRSNEYQRGQQRLSQQQQYQEPMMLSSSPYAMRSARQQQPIDSYLADQHQQLFTTTNGRESSQLGTTTTRNDCNGNFLLAPGHRRDRRPSLNAALLRRSGGGGAS